ncbi:hypothetical protein [Pedobacter metabolipauper]|uniref:Uncharacterized protein n=1 Tax=Pedobacter metabolipauper TaxID=425513 RepID=A0A4R6SRN0_9SPHI|nr:hypothetical protein [Pedobacter metabolipauper]TDQ07102.1 hypothetical protein ATK78_4118 [Pedobacter metabolipauper]
MAKEIKAIKCPQCGSTAKTEIRPEVYRCTSCQTEYFLDDNNITVNYNHNYNHNYPNNSGLTPYPKLRKTLNIVSLAFGILFLTVFVISLLTKDKTTSGYVTASADGNEEKEFDASTYDVYPMLHSETLNPMAMAVENRDYNAEGDKTKDGLYVAFYDVLTKQQIGEQKVGNDDLSSSDIKVKTFSDGNTYIIVGNILYQADRKAGKLTDVGKLWFASKTELQVGIATATFIYDDYGDGLILMTNDGKKLYYYPLVKKLYSEDELDRAQEGFDSLLPGSKEKDYFTFTKESTDFSNEKIQLLKIRYKDNVGGPKDMVEKPSWRKDYGGSGIFTDRDPYTKELIGSPAESRIISWKDFTPGRSYFSPDVVFDDGSSLLIQFKADANPKSPYKIQQLNTSTNAAEWTLTLNDEENFSKVIKYKTGYLVVTRQDSIKLLDFKGHKKTAFKIN